MNPLTFQKNQLNMSPLFLAFLFTVAGCGKQSFVASSSEKSKNNTNAQVLPSESDGDATKPGEKKKKSVTQEFASGVKGEPNSPACHLQKPCNLKINTQASASLTFNSNSNATQWIGALSMESVANGTGQLGNPLVYALGKADNGRVIFSGDTTYITFNEEGSCPLWDWLSKRKFKDLGNTNGNDPLPESMPRILSLGYGAKGVLCTKPPAYDALPEAHFVVSRSIPEIYLNKTKSLINDFEVIIYCYGDRTEGDVLSTKGADLLEGFVKTDGGGLYVLTDYVTQGSIVRDNEQDLSYLTEKFGLHFKNDDWAGASTDIKELALENLEICDEDGK